MNKYLKPIKLILIMVMLIYSAGMLQAAGGDIVVQLRLYQGFDKEGNHSGAIVSSYYLRKLPGDNVIPYMEIAKEKKSIMRIYKLKNVRRIAGLDLVLKEGKGKIQRRDVALNGRKLTLQLNTIAGKKDRFKVEILENPPRKKALLQTEIIAPEMKTAVMGFKDSSEKIYFLAFNRMKDRAVVAGTGKKQTTPPKLAHIVEPEYPEPALAEEIEGDIFIEGTIDRKGNISRLAVVQGNPVLAKSAEKALSRWQYEPKIANGAAQSKDIAVIVNYRLEPGAKEKLEKWSREFFKESNPLMSKWKKEQRLLEQVYVAGKSGSKKKPAAAAPKLLNVVEPAYPSAAMKKNLEGGVILEGIVGLKGNVVHLEAIKGDTVLVDASKKAVSQWKYAPLKVDGVSKPFDFVVVVHYRLKPTGKKELEKTIDAFYKKHENLLGKWRKEKRIIEEIIVTAEK
jgi:TonB family protein